MSRWIFFAFFASYAAVVAAVARAQAPAIEGYALVIGSNVGGKGQVPLRFAEEDAGRVADVLTAVGGYVPEHVQKLLHPSTDELRGAIERIRLQISSLAQAGKQTRFYFYYSGHARADALNLGSQELPLSELRERLLGLPATISIVVLDACQSGAFSRVKGAGPATDFSFNSIERLNTEGIAVVASSSAKELSQESELLRSSFFTHHWLVALRGAGDRDGDGRVTLSEAYQYAYNHTLATTSETSVGEQHATLETNFRGKDDVALTHPAAASAHLRILSPFRGRVLVQSLPSWSVLAEVDKAAGAPLVLALPAGNYAATLRRDDIVSRCSLSLRDGSETILAASQCAPLRMVATETKGDLGIHHGYAYVPDGREEGWIFEATGGVRLASTQDAYVRRLNDFALTRQSDDWPRFTLSAGRRLHPNLVLGVSYFNLQSAEYQRNHEEKQAFRWNAHALGAFVQADLPVVEPRKANLFVRAGMGASLAWTSFDAVSPEHDFMTTNPSFGETTVLTHKVTQHFVRPCGWLSAGLQAMPWRQFGFHLELRYTFAPAIENQLGDVHNLGSGAFLMGIRARTWE